VAGIQARGIRVVLMTQPFLWKAEQSPEEAASLWLGAADDGQHYYSSAALADGLTRYNERMQRLCDDLHLECLDLANMVPRSTEMFYDDAHFTEKGAAVVAQKLADYLVKHPPFDSAPQAPL
jgi:hypothetical protein